jgi:hypothetical protein
MEWKTDMNCNATIASSSSTYLSISYKFAALLSTTIAVLTTKKIGIQLNNLQGAGAPLFGGEANKPRP